MLTVRQISQVYFHERDERGGLKMQFHDGDEPLTQEQQGLEYFVSQGYTASEAIMLCNEERAIRAAKAKWNDEGAEPEDVDARADRLRLRLREERTRQGRIRV